MAQADKAERKLQLACDELAKAEAVLQHATTAEALADRFRFDADGTPTHELKDGSWEVLPTASPPLACHVPVHAPLGARFWIVWPDHVESRQVFRIFFPGGSPGMVHSNSRLLGGHCCAGLEQFAGVGGAE